MSRQPSPDQTGAAAPSRGSSAERSESTSSDSRSPAATEPATHSRSGSHTSRSPRRQVSQMAHLPPPPPFLAQPGVPPIPWEHWEPMFTNYIRATGGRDHSPGRKGSILQTCLGAEGQRIFRHLTPPQTIPPANNNEYDIALLTLATYYGKKRNEVVERHRFMMRHQMENESVDAYMLALRTLAATCDYGGMTDTMLRDQFVCHTSDPKIQAKCLDAEGLTLDKAIHLARTVEDQRKNLQMFKPPAKDVPTKEIQAVQAASQKATADQKQKWQAKGNSSLGRKGCYRCGAPDHRASLPTCPAAAATCSYCNKYGHFAKVCRTRLNAIAHTEDRKVSMMQQNPTDEHYATDPNASPKFVLQIGDPKRCPTETLRVNDKPISMLIDSGSPFTIINETTAQHLDLQKWDPPDFQMDAYGSIPISIVGSATVNIVYKRRNIQARIHISAKGSDLLGWEHQGGLQMVLRPGTECAVSTLEASSTCGIIGQFPAVFTDKLGLLKNFTHKLQLTATALPVVHKVRDVPIRRREQLRAELQKLCDQDIIEPIQQSEWLFPTVLVNKPDSSIRLCVDLGDLNSQIWQERYPAPKIHVMLHSIGRPTKLSVLDLSSAYHQVPLAPESRPLTSFITTEGAYRFKRMPFGLSTASAVFQRIMDQILKGIDKARCFQDDILVFGDTDEEHDTTLTSVLRRLQANGLTVKPKKCQLGARTVTYLGHEISKEGIHPKTSLVQAIVNACAPQDKDTLRSFLGLAEFYNKFVDHFSTKTEPMRDLLKTHTKFQWTDRQQQSFQQIKDNIAHATALRTFDPNCATILTTDASQVGLGAVLAQLQNGKECIVGYASRALTQTEQRYATIEREALGCWWAIHHFRHYLWGARFTLRTDHRPLVHIFTTKGSATASPRIANWYARMMPFDYQVQYLPGNRNHPADAMSRMSPQHTVTEASTDNETDWDECYIINSVEGAQKSAITKQEWVEAMNADEAMTAALKYIGTKWPGNARSMQNEEKAYWQVKDELTTGQDILIRSNKMVVPKALRQRILEQAHHAHNGIEALKRMLRDQYWWPTMDKEIEAKVKGCIPCQDSDKTKRTSTTPMQPVKTPDKPWHTIGIDIAGPITVDSNSPIRFLSLL